jgi:hypothetical protein
MRSLQRHKGQLQQEQQHGSTRISKQAKKEVKRKRKAGKSDGW